MNRNPEFKITAEADIPRAMEWANNLIRRGLKGGPVMLRTGRESRSIEQNNRLWPSLNDVARQIDWPRGTGLMRSKDDWKVIFMSAFNNEVNVIQGMNGELINLSLSTSSLPKRDFADLITFIQIKGDEWGVKWSDPALKLFDEYVEARRAAHAV